MPTWDDRLPLISTAGRKQVIARTMACASLIAERIGVPTERVQTARVLGCGNYGCTLLIEGLPRDRNVLKVTTDNLEANAAKAIVEDGTAKDEAGLPRIHQVFRVGKCSVLPKMRPLEYTRAAVTYANGVAYVTDEPARWRGPGAPFRPLWVLQREELDDAWPALQKLGVSQRQAKGCLYSIFQYARYLTEVQTSFGRPTIISRRGLGEQFQEQLDREIKKVHGQALVGAIEWLIERDMSWLDMQKIANLGWRPGVGLVIRDIGYTASGPDQIEEIETVGGVAGKHKFVPAPTRARGRR